METSVTTSTKHIGIQPGIDEVKKYPDDFLPTCFGSENEKPYCSAFDCPYWEKECKYKIRFAR